MVSMKLAAVHSADRSRRATATGRSARVSTSRTGSRRVSATSGGSWLRIVATVSAPRLGLAEDIGDRGGEDEEGEQREHRQEGQIAGVDEAVVVDADRDALEHFPRVGARGFSFSTDLVAERRLACSPDACAGLPVTGGKCPSCGWRVKPRAPRAGCRRSFQRSANASQLGVAGGQVDGDA